MNVLVILAHPNPGSFNHAVAAVACQTLESLGHDVWFHDLDREEFPPALSTGELSRVCELPEIVARHCEELVHAGGIVIIHPNWWGQPPALLKGWVDRVFRRDVAYQFLDGDSGEGVPMGLLKAKAAVVFNTSDTPVEREQRVFKDPLETIWKNCIFGFCGIEHFERRMFSVIVTSTPGQRRAWLQEVREIVSRSFPAIASAAVRSGS